MRPIPAALTLLIVCASACPIARADAPPGPGASTAGPPRPRRPQFADAVHAVRASEPIVIDGILDEPVWQSDNAVVQLQQADPDQGEEPSQRTEVRVAYDDEAIYVGARMYDRRPDSIVARLSRRDNDSGSDEFGVAFDTFHDRRTGYYFLVSAAGTELDGTLMNDDWSDDSWDGVWSARTHRDSLGWTAEMRIPFSQMRSRGGDHMVWGIDFERVISRCHEDDKLVYAPIGESGFVSRFVELDGLDGVRTTHTVEVTPYSTGKAEYLAHDLGDPYNSDPRYTPALGADVRTGVGSKFTLNATINPDFGQVEIDPAVVNLSDAETYFNEKRPFFTEGLSVFRCGNNGASDYWNFNWPEPTFFYTRRIGRTPEGALPDTTTYSHLPGATHILGALKLTGQPSPGFNVGAVQAVTREEFGDFELPDGSRHTLAVEPLTYYGVMRGIHSYNNEHQGLGLMALETARELDGTGLADQLNRNALVTAMDGWTALDAKRTWVLSGYVAGSRVDGTPARIAALEEDPQHYYQRPDRPDLGVDANATSLSGYVGRLWLNRQTGPWMSNSAIGVMSPGFEVNDLGYGSRSDVINDHVGLGYMWKRPWAGAKDFWVIGALADGWNFAGQQTMNQYFLKANLDQMNAWTWTFSGGYLSHDINDRRTRGGPAMLDPRSWWTDALWSGNSRAKLSCSIEVSPNGDEAGSFDVPIAPAVTWKPSSRLSLSAGPTYEYNRQDAQYVTQEVDPLALATGGHYVFAHLDQQTVGAQLRMDCSLTTNLSIQVFAQPLVSSGRYTNYRELAQPDTYDFIVYGRDDGSTLTYDGTNYFADPDGAGPMAAFEIGHPDFTYRTIRGDAVLRWEYVPGSTIYVVWTQDRTVTTGDGDFDFAPSFSTLAATQPNNIFLVKVSHHFGM
ncbi:MAG TPA: DUF5916 domain-containing protein [Candidatus Acidoferrales bacterium]|nr:DUF5916 domain-containing protein [Candidatus Acidoferrales bacterium]